MERSIYRTDEKIIELNNNYFAPNKPMGFLGHKAVFLVGEGGNIGSERYVFKHEGDFFYE